MDCSHKLNLRRVLVAGAVASACLNLLLAHQVLLARLMNSRELDAKFKRDEAQVYENIKRPLYEFLSKEFIETYKRDNPGETPGSCCVPDARSESASQNAIKKMLLGGGGNNKFGIAVGSGSEKNIQTFFDWNLVVTCETYWHMLHHDLFEDLSAEVDRTMRGDWSFIKEQSDEFQEGFFRYKFCQRLTDNMEAIRNYTNILVKLSLATSV